MSSTCALDTVSKRHCIVFGPGSESCSNYFTISIVEFFKTFLVVVAANQTAPTGTSPVCVHMNEAAQCIRPSGYLAKNCLISLLAVCQDLMHRKVSLCFCSWTFFNGYPMAGSRNFFCRQNPSSTIELQSSELETCIVIAVEERELSKIYFKPIFCNFWWRQEMLLLSGSSAAVVHIYSSNLIVLFPPELVSCNSPIKSK